MPQIDGKFLQQPLGRPPLFIAIRSLRLEGLNQVMDQCIQPATAGLERPLPQTPAAGQIGIATVRDASQGIPAAVGDPVANWNLRGVIRNDMNPPHKEGVGSISDIFDGMGPRQEKPGAARGRICPTVDVKGAGAAVHRKEHSAFHAGLNQAFRGAELKPVGMDEDRAGLAATVFRCTRFDRKSHVFKE